MSAIYPDNAIEKEKKYKLIACEIMLREACYLLSQTHQVVDVVFLKKGLHDLGEAKMKAAIQAELDRIDPQEYEAALLGYGLCNNGILGLHAKVPIVVPRAHDCITLFMGSKKRYRDYFDSNPGTFYKTAGWIERGSSLTSQGSVLDSLGLKGSYAQYAEAYGEENAAYLAEMLGGWVGHYTKMTFIDMSIAKEDGAVSFGDIETFRARTKREAEEKGWRFEDVKGDLRLIERLINCQWNDEEFLIIPPGKRIMADDTEAIIACD